MFTMNDFLTISLQTNRSPTPRVVVGGLGKGKRYAFALTVQVRTAQANGSGYRPK